MPPPLPPLRFSANLSFLFADVAFPERFARAARAGFAGVEYMFPYAWAADELARCLRENGLVQVLHNLPPGDWDAGERGIACLPGREAEFRAGVEQGIDYARTLGCTQLNCLAGLAPAGADGGDEVDGVDGAELRAEVHATFAANLRYAARRLGDHGIRLLVEPINSRVDMPGFWLDTPRKALALLAELNEPNLWLQYDVYHAQIMEGDLSKRLQKHLDGVGHVQIAGVPDRHEPDGGEVNFPHLFDLLDTLGYGGFVGCEYRPKAGTSEGLDWLHLYQASRKSHA